jgi:hypothetical protein
MSTKTKNIERKRGGATLFKPEYYDQIEKFMKLGLTEKVIAEEIWEISTCTMDHWKRTNPKFLRCLKKGKEVALAEVANALYMAAIGFERPDTVILSGTEKIYSENGRLIGSTTVPVYAPVMKYYPPNTYAAQKILAARQRDVWSENVNININHSGTVNVNFLQQIENPEMITDDDLMLALNRGVQLAIEKNNAESNN